MFNDNGNQDAVVYELFILELSSLAMDSRPVVIPLFLFFFSFFLLFPLGSAFLPRLHVHTLSCGLFFSGNLLGERLWQYGGWFSHLAH
jgi:hypothetical protein